LQAASEHLSVKRPVAIDNTNADPQTRGHWVELAKQMKVPIRCVLFTTPPDACRHNDTVRALHSGHAEINPERREMLPFMAFTGYKSRYREPSLEEGFEDIVTVDFHFHGDDEQWRVWSRYWT
jgi:bifunctional polynucleotide phosphatase/kinase